MRKVQEFYDERFAWIFGFSLALWFFLPAFATPLLMGLLVGAPGRYAERKAFRVTVYALASLYMGLLAYTQSSTGVVPRDAGRYYEGVRGFYGMSLSGFMKWLFADAEPVTNTLKFLVARLMPQRFQTISIVYVFITMFAFSLGFDRISRRTGISPRDRSGLWIALFLFCFPLTETGELMRNFAAMSLFYYAFALLADRNYWSIVILATALGVHKAVLVFLPALAFAFMPMDRKRGFSLVIAAAAIGFIGPYTIASWIGNAVPAFAGIASRASAYSQQAESMFYSPKRDYITLGFYCMVGIIALANLKKEGEGAKSRAPIVSLGIYWLAITIATIGTGLLFERMFLVGGVFFATFLLATARAEARPPLDRALVWLQLSFQALSAALLYNAALRPAGHYTMTLMNGEFSRLALSSVPTILRFSAPW